MIYPKIPLAQSIIELFLANGITTIVISPGSRNAPLTIGFVSHPGFECFSIADERSAAFFAVGMAQQKRKPIALVCTSGSALLNYYPAFAEAFYSQIPLVVLSADRPQSKIDIGDGQTIRQENVFANHSLFNANLDENVCPENDFKIQKALHFAIYQKGPVHINAPFEEPLYETVNTLSIGVPELILQEKEPFSKKEDLDQFAAIWNQSNRKMVLVGVNEPQSLSSEVVEFLANESSLMVLTETTSNLHHPNFGTNIDTLITPFSAQDFEDFQPDLLITFGGMVVSKRIKAFLRKYKPKHHWHIDELRAYNTYNALSHHFEWNPQQFWDEFMPLTQTGSSDYFARWNALKQTRKIKHDQYCLDIPFSDFKFFEKTLAQLPKNCQLQISNSSAIRYAQLFPIDSSIEVFCNRGTSGIDGSTSTAIGAAVGSGKTTILITGDISFLYDSNALWNSYIPKNFKIILFNNGGGGIFRILPGHEESPVFNTFFETTHNYTAEHLAKMFGFNYQSACDEKSLDTLLSTWFETNDEPAILEVFTPTQLNDTILLNYFKSL